MRKLSLSGISFVLLALLITGMIGAPLLKNNSYAQTVENKRPNILLIVADDFGWSDLKSYGGDIIAPNLDTLANQSLQFTNFHVMPVCSPTRSVTLNWSRRPQKRNGHNGRASDSKPKKSVRI